MKFANFDAIAEILGEPKDVVEGDLRSSAAAKRASGLSFEEREALINAIEWEHLAQATRPNGHPASELFSEKFSEVARRHAFDLPLVLLERLIATQKLRGDRIADAVRWLEFGDEEAFGRLGSWSVQSFPRVWASPVIEERVVRRIWGSLGPVLENAVQFRLRGALNASAPHRAIARTVAKDLGLPARVPFGHPNRQYTDRGPVLAVAREIDDGLFAELLKATLKELKTKVAAFKLDAFAGIRWDEIGDSADSKTLRVDRYAAGVRVSGSIGLRKAGTLQGKFSIKTGSATPMEMDVSEGAAKAMVSQWQLSSAYFAGLFAQHPTLIKAKNLLTGGPDVVAAVVDHIDQGLAKRAVTGLTKNNKVPETEESISLLLPRLEKVTPKQVEAIAAAGFLDAARVATEKAKLTPKQRAKVHQAVLDAGSPRVAKMFEPAS